MRKRGMIYLGENECPKCGGKLNLVTIERNISPLNKYGIPIVNKNTIDDEVEIWLVCNTCKSTYDAESSGMKFGIKRELPKIKPEIKEFNPFLS